MSIDDNQMYINRIIQGGIYFLTLDDGKLRPYVVISKNSGYGMNVILLLITSKCTSPNFMLPVVVRGKVSFIRTSGTQEVPVRTIIDSEFGGIIRPDILSLAISFYGSRIMKMRSEDDEALHKKEKEYLKGIEERRYPLYADERKIFKVQDFLNGKYCEEKKSSPASFDAGKENIHKKNIKVKFESKKYPKELKDWKLEDLKMFRTDMFKLDLNELMCKYNSTANRIQFLQRSIKHELRKRKKVLK